jgi:Spy/CpxP family protein refolding chaperone
MKKVTSVALALAIVVGVAGVAMAQGPGYGPGYGYGPGMTGGYGPGMTGRGYGPGYGYGPGMMGGYPGGSGLAALNLTDDQQDKISKILEDTRNKNWGVMGQMRSEQFKLREMYYSDKLDPNAVADQQKKVDDLRRQMVKSHVETRNQISALLNPDQRQRFRSFGPWWVDETDD